MISGVAGRVAKFQKEKGKDNLANGQKATRKDEEGFINEPLNSIQTIAPDR